MRKCLVFIALLVWAMAYPAHAGLVSNFDTNTEGWNIFNDATRPQWNAAGYIEAKDLGYNQCWYFAAPNSWNGDWREYAGQTISYSLMPTLLAGKYVSREDILIYSGDAYLSWTSNIRPSFGTWNDFAIELNQSNFKVNGSATFESILANVTGFRIRGEFGDDSDKAALDNVRVGAVPLPGAAWLLGSGLLGLMGFKRRTKS